MIDVSHLRYELLSNLIKGERQVTSRKFNTRVSPETQCTSCDHNGITEDTAQVKSWVEWNFVKLGSTSRNVN